MLDDLDNLRERSAASPFDEELATLEDEEERRRRRGPERPIFGTTAPQRFVLALMLFLNVAVLGCLCSLATGNISIDALYTLVSNLFGISL
jgi:hypothetical protein